METSEITGIISKGKVGFEVGTVPWIVGLYCSTNESGQRTSEELSSAKACNSLGLGDGIWICCSRPWASRTMTVMLFEAGITGLGFASAIGAAAMVSSVEPM